MDRRAVEEFVSRDWDALGRSKAAYWAERFRENGARPAWDAANALLLEIRRMRPDYPTERDRDQDLDEHLKLRARLDRVAHAFARR